MLLTPRTTSPTLTPSHSPGIPMPLALPSLGDAVADARRTLRRFPLALLAAVVAATAFILMIEEIGRDWTHVRLMATAALGILLFTATQLLAERLKRGAAVWAGIHLAGLLLLGGFFTGYEWWSEQIFFARFVACAVAFVLFGVLVPFVGRGLPNAFWQFCRILLERAVLAAAFALVLFLGLALALAAADNLFGVDVPETGYGRLWGTIAFVFSSWFFLAGVPTDVEALEAQREYPAVIRVFAQFILVPLTSGYLVILTLYLGKVVVTWDWPSGWIGNLVSGVAAVGIAAVLLTHPEEASESRPWVATFGRQFWLAILPSVAMLWLALYQRVHQYGLTEPRYFLGALSVWLAGIAVYYAVTRSRNIAVIPATLAILAVVTFAGPWSGYALSERSQVGRLRAALTHAGMLVDGTLRAAPDSVSAADREVVSGTVRYLVAVHGTDAIASWFTDATVRRAVVRAGVNGRVHAEEVDRWADTVATHLGVRYERPRPRTAVRRVIYATPDAGAIPLQGFDYLVPVAGTANAADTGYRAVWSPAPLAVRVLHGSDTVLVAPLDSMLAGIRARDVRREPVVWVRDAQRAPHIPGLRSGMFVTDVASRGARARVMVERLEGRDSAGVVTVDAVVGRVLVAVRR